MATAVVMPKQGQSVESCIIVAWKKAPGDQVSPGETLCEVETDKALLEIESPASGTLLELFFQEGDEVPVLANIAAIGEPGEDVSALRPDGAHSEAAGERPPVEESVPPTGSEPEPVTTAGATPKAPETAAPVVARTGASANISPRAGTLAAQNGLDIAAMPGTGPGGRIIERDVQQALARKPPLTPLARSMLAQGEFEAPARGSGPSGRIMAGDLRRAGAAEAAPVVDEGAETVREIPLKGVRKIIAGRMLNSLQTTAQLTLNATADARALLAFRRRLKDSPESLGLQQVTINDLLLFAVSRTLAHFPALNARFTDGTIRQYDPVHLGVAVDTPRGLIVPVIRRANTLSLRQISEAAKQLATACVEGTVSPDDLTGGTFTVTNLGQLGIETFTPILNVPEAAILGVGNINLKPVEIDGEVNFIPHLGLSLTINHQLVDGAPAARFLQALAQRLAEMDLTLAL